MRLVDRDYLIFREVDRWRFCLGRHIKILTGFSNQRACDRRLHKLIDMGYLKREKIIYGVPSIYKLTYKSKMLISANKRQDKIRLDNIIHDITVLDTAIFFHYYFKIPFKNIISEKQLHSKDGFNIRNHQPDYIFSKDNKTYCVEVELSLKSKERLENNLKSNFMAYDIQIWIIKDYHSKLYKILKNKEKQYSNMKIINIEKVGKYVRDNFSYRSAD